MDLEVVTKEFLSLADWCKAQTFHVHQFLEVVMVDKHEDFMLRALKIVLSGFESLNNG